MKSYFHRAGKVLHGCVLMFCLFAGASSSLAIPPMATTLEATDLSLTGSSLSVTLNGNVRLGDPATTVFFEWGVGDRFDNTAGLMSFPPGHATIPYSVTLTGLSPGVPYQFRLVAKNPATSRGAARRFWAWEPEMTLNGDDPLVYEGAPSFVDPGVTITGPPRAIAAGTDLSLVLKADGSVFGWGNSSDSVLPVPSSITEVVAISVLAGHGLALKSDGTVVGWGSNSEGQCNVPSYTDVVAIAAGYRFSLALRSDGTVVAWGHNDDGQATVPDGLTHVSAIGAGYDHSLALTGYGAVVAWGSDDEGEATVPMDALSYVTAIAAGGYHNLALKSDGTVVAWGRNHEGQATVPDGLTGVVAIAAGSHHSLALKSDGTVVAWGRNPFGLSTVPAGLADVVAISGGVLHNLTLKSDGTIVGWGRNEYGESSVPADIRTQAVAATVDGTVDPITPSDYPLTYSFTTELGVPASTTRLVQVVDTLPPELTLLGDHLVIHDYKAPFTDPGATAHDQCAGELTSAIVVTGAVDPMTLGTYELTYTVDDTHGHIVEDTRTVQVMTVRSFIVGDEDGDGAVDQDEFDQVVRNYFGAQSRPYITNLSTDDQGRCQMTLLNSDSWNFSAEVSTDLQNWAPLGPVEPVLEFLDPDAAVEPQRFYRLTWP